MQAPTPDQARDALLAADRSSDALAARTRWLTVSLLGYATASFVTLLLIGLGGPAGVGLGMAAWVVTIVGLTTWRGRQQVLPRGHSRRVNWGFGAWTVIYGLTVIFGTAGLHGQPWFWVPAALATAAPLVVAALWPGADRPGAARPRP